MQDSSNQTASNQSFITLNLEDSTTLVDAPKSEKIIIDMQACDVVSVVRQDLDLLISTSNNHEIIIENFFLNPEQLQTIYFGNQLSSEQFWQLNLDAETDEGVIEFLLESVDDNSDQLMCAAAFAETSSDAAALGLASLVALGGLHAKKGSNGSDDNYQVETTTFDQDLDNVVSEVLPTDAALAKIAAFAEDSSNPVPTVEDYFTAGITGVTEDNLAAVNAKVESVSEVDVDTQVEVQALVNQQAQEQADSDAEQTNTDAEQTDAEPEQPVTDAEQPVAESEQPVTDAEQTDSETQQPTTDAEQVDAETEQPVTEPEQPVTGAEQVDAETEQPVAESEQPVTDAEQTDSETQQPITDAEQSDLESQQPNTGAAQVDAETEQPVAEPEQPLTDAEQTDSETQQPTTDAEQVDAETEQPVAQSEQPVTDAEQTDSETQQPTTDAEQVDSETEQPVTEPEQPVTDTEQPDSETQQPTTDAEQVDAETEQPVTEPEQPVTGAEQAGSETQQPTTDADLVGSETEQPVTEPEQPVAESEQPVTDAERTDSETQQPITDAEQSDSETEQPVTDAEQSDSETQQPTSDAEQVDAETEQPVAESEQPLTDAEQTDSETQQPNTDAEQVDAETEQPVAEPEQPVKEPEQPVTDAEQTDSETQQPTTDAEQVDAETEQPVAEPEQPVTDAEQTDSETQQPNTDAEQVDAETEQPGAEPEQPVTDAEQTNSKTQQPITDAEQVDAETEQPVAEPEQPVTDAEQTDSETQQPNTDAEQVDAETEQPVTELEQPVTDTEQPDSETQQPTSDANQVDAETEQPVTEPEQPVTDAEQSNSETQQPTTDAEQVDAETEQPAAESEQPVTGAQQTDSETQQPITDAEQSDLESQQPNTGAAQVDAETEQPVAEPEQPVAESEQPVTDAEQTDSEIQQPITDAEQSDSETEQQNANAAQAATDAALSKIAAFAEDNTNPAPSVDDYATAGITGVTDDNLTAVNAKVDSVNAEDADTQAEVQALVELQAQEQAEAEAAQAATDTALSKIAAFAEDNTNPAPSVDEYTTAGITGVTDDNLEAVNAKVDSVNGVDADTQAEVQALVDQQAQEQAEAEAALAATNAAQDKIADYAEDNTNPAPSVDDYATAGITAVTDDNLEAVNAKLDSVDGADADTQSEVQALVDLQAQEQAEAEAQQAATDAALSKIAAYAEDNTNPAPSVDDYGTAGITGVTDDNLGAVNAKLDSVDRADADTQAEVQALVDQQAQEQAITEAQQAEAEAAQAATDAAQDKIAAYAEDNTNPAPSVDDYATAGITGVTDDNLEAVNAKVDSVNGLDADTQAEVQALVELQAQEQAEAEAQQAATDAALSKIAAFAEDNSNPAPSVDDYATAGITGVTNDNLTAVNAKLDSVGGADADTQAEVQALVEQQAQEQAEAEAALAATNAALSKIAAYAEDNTNPAPSVDDYATAGITGVTEDNLDAVNAKLDSVNGADADTQAEVQALVEQQAQEQAEAEAQQAEAEAQQAATDAALSKIAAYAEDNTNPAPSVEDYATAGITGVTDDNLTAVNAKVDSVNAADADTQAEVQALVEQQAQEQAEAEAQQAATDAALGKIAAYAEDNTNPAPSVDDYATAGITDVTEDNLEAVNAKVDSVNAEDADNQAEVQALVELQAQEQAEAEAQQAEAEAAQAATDAAQDKITAYAEDNTNPAPSVEDYATAGVTGVTDDNLAAVNAKVDSVNAADADTQAEVQALVEQQAQEQAEAEAQQAEAEAQQAATDAALSKIAAYAEDNTNPAPSVDDYATAGITGVTDDNLTAVNAKLDSVDGANADTQAEVQALVELQAQEQAEAEAAQAATDAALSKIAAYAEDNTNPAPSVEDYATAGITGVTDDNLEAVNAKVDSVNAADADTQAEVQALVEQQAQEQAEAEAAQAATEAALSKIAAYAEDNTNPAPSVDDYATAGITGVTDDNLVAVNAKLDSVNGVDADTQAEVQALVEQQAQEQAEAEAALAATNAALSKIVAYAEDNSNPAPSVEDYATAGITDVTDDNLEAVNAKLDSVNGADADTQAEVQALVELQAQEQAEAEAALAATNAALSKIAAYAEDNTNPAPSVDDYATAGITGVTDDNLEAVNAKLDSVNGADADTQAEVQALVELQAQEQAEAEAALAATNAALSKIAAYAEDNSNPAPSVDDYATAGITGVTDDNLVAVNAKLDSVNGVDADTQAEVQALVELQAQEQAEAEAAQAATDAAQDKIAAFAEDNSNPAPSVDDYATAGITGVTDDNLEAVNAKLDSVNGADADTQAEVQALVELQAQEQAEAEAAQAATDAALGKIAAYAEDNTNPAPSVGDYATAGITGVTDDNLTAVNAKVDSVNGADADTQAEVQALVELQAQEQAEAEAALAATNAALSKIAAYAEDNTNPAPSVDDYATAGVTGVTDDNLTAVNAKVDSVNGADADTQAEVQALVDQQAQEQATIDSAMDIIADYAADNSNTPPTVDNYASAGVTGVNESNLAIANENIDAVDRQDADTTAEVQDIIGRPTTSNVSATGAEDASSIAITLQGEDWDGSITEFMLSNLPENGSLYFDSELTQLVEPGTNYNADNNQLSLYFVPDENWSGETQFDYVAKDNDGKTDPSPATATITVTNTNDAPEVSVGEGALLGLAEAGALGIISLEDQGLSAYDVDGNLNQVVVSANALVGVTLTGLITDPQWVWSEKLAEEFGINVQSTTDQTGSLLDIANIGYVSTVTFTSVDGGDLDNGLINELLATVYYDPLKVSGLNLAAVDAVTSITIEATDSFTPPATATDNNVGLLGVSALDSDPATQLVYEGTDEDNTLTGNANNNRLYGYDGNDVIDGLAGNDLIRGGAGNDIISGGEGNDILIDGVGADQIFGEQGNDTIEIADLGFATIDGGSGEDTLVLGGDGILFDLAATEGTINNMEVIDMRGNGANELILDEEAILNITDEDNLIIIEGDTEDTLSINGATQTDSIVLNGTSYDVYQLGSSTIYAEADIIAEI